MEIILIFVSAIFVNNVVLSQFLGICPFLGVSKTVGTAVGMTAAVTFVIAIATLVTFLLQKYVLEPLQLEFLQTVSFILVIASLVQMVEIIIKKISPSLYQALTRMKLTVCRNSSCSGTSTYFCRRKVTSVAMAITKVTAAVMPTAVPTFLDTPRNGQIPRNWLRTTLLTKIAETNIRMISIVKPV